MSANVPWESVIESLAGQGWSARVVGAERLIDLHARVAAVLDSGDLPAEAAARLAGDLEAVPPDAPPARSVIVAAVARPLTQATLTIGGDEDTVPVPPHYAGGTEAARTGSVAAAGAALAPFGYAAARFEPALKTLAACAGLARYGRNNIAYVPGLGSYFMLAACVNNAPPPGDAVWEEPLPLARCERCRSALSFG